MALRRIAELGRRENMLSHAPQLPKTTFIMLTFVVAPGTTELLEEFFSILHHWAMTRFAYCMFEIQRFGSDEALRFRRQYYSIEYNTAENWTVTEHQFNRGFFRPWSTKPLDCRWVIKTLREDDHKGEHTDPDAVMMLDFWYSTIKSSIDTVRELSKGSGRLTKRAMG